MLMRLILQDKETTEEGGDEDDSAHSKGSERELAGAESRSSTLAGSGGTGGTASSTRGDSTVASTSQLCLLGAGRLRTRALETGTSTSTVLEVVAGATRESRKLVVADSDVPGLGL